MRSIWLLCSCLFLLNQATAQPRPLRTGKHGLTLQWITFEQASRGEVTILALGKGQYTIKGEQRARKGNDYVIIDGVIRDAGKELLFEGKIESSVSYVNNGQPCLRTGPLVFKTTGQRKYWRLQQMLNCDGTSTDYVDLFF